MNVRDGVFTKDGLAFIDEQQASRLAGVIVEVSDILLNITGASVARVCRAPADVLPARVNQHVAIIRPSGSLNTFFLESYFLCPSVKGKLLKIAGAGATREAITKGELEQFEVACPPRDLQDRFGHLAARCQLLRDEHLESLARTEELVAALQHRAFRGEL